jgi:O-antigen/teichoic acid export membrane protein
MATTSLITRPETRDQGTTAKPRSKPRRLASRVLSAPLERCNGRRIASNFAVLSAAELVCRTTSVIVTLSLAKRLGVIGYGRVEFAFNVVFWLVLLVRDSTDVIVARELSRHPRLIRPLVNQVIAFKSLIAIILYISLAMVSMVSYQDQSDRIVLGLYGLMLFTTAIGLDFVYRGTERMGLIAASLCVRTLVYACGVMLWINDASRLIWVPIWLAIGEATGIAIVWSAYLKQYRIPRPRLRFRFLRIIIQRGRTICLMQLSQVIINSADLMIVGLMSPWSEVGLYGAPHRMVTALLTFGLIFQQASFPMLARLWRQTAVAGQEALDSLIEVLVTALVPLAVGGTVLAEPLMELILPPEYAGAGFLLALSIWRVPLLILAYLYQTTLIALNREIVGVRSLVTAAVLIGPLIVGLRLALGMPGAVLGVLLIGLGLVLTGYGCLRREGRQPAWHHHLARPVIASLGMVPVCLILLRWHVLLAVFGGGIAYCSILLGIGGMRGTRLWKGLFRLVPNA